MNTHAINASPIYNSSNGDPVGFYYNLEDSIFRMKKILYFQFKDVTTIKKIIFDLLLIFDKKGKCNTLFMNQFRKNIIELFYVYRVSLNTFEIDVIFYTG